MRSFIITLFLFLITGCSSIRVIEDDKKSDFSQFMYSYCSLHFCFYSDTSYDLSYLGNVSENIYYYFSLNYSFNDLIDGYPYRFTVVSSTSEIESDSKKILFSTSVCNVADRFVYAVVDDIFGDYKMLYPWLYYGFANYSISKFCKEKDTYYSQLLKSKGNNISLKTAINLDPSKLSKSEKELYYAFLSAFISSIITKYSYYKFSMFVNELIRSGDIKRSSEIIFGEDIFYIYQYEGTFSSY